MFFYDNERFAAYIDGTNFYMSARNLDFDIDYQKLLGWFQKRRGVFLRAFYYTALPEDGDFSPIKPLVDWLHYNGYMVVTKPLKEFHDAEQNRQRYKGNMDGEMIVDIVTSSSRLDHILLFSGDGDFCSAVKYVQRQGKRVSVVSTTRTTPPMAADELRRQADHFIELEDLRPEIKRDSEENKRDSEALNPTFGGGVRSFGEDRRFGSTAHFSPQGKVSNRR